MKKSSYAINSVWLQHKTEVFPIKPHLNLPNDDHINIFLRNSKAMPFLSDYEPCTQRLPQNLAENLPS